MFNASYIFQTIDGSSSSKMCQQQLQEQQHNINTISASPGGSFSGVAATTTANTTSCLSPHKITVKPKPTKRHVNNNQTNYSPMPSCSFNSPKNPNELLPFQPTGELLCYIIL